MHQQELSVLAPTDYYEGFRKLYFHLYSNSNASRAERIISDISKLLLIAISKDTDSNQKQILSFLKNEVSANDSILKIILSEYPNLFDKTDKFAVDDTSLRHGLDTIYNLDLKNAPSHMLGDAFQALIGPKLRGDKGQFFTPKSVVRAMIEILAPDSDSKVVDPACGTGGFLTETCAYWDKNGKSHGILIGSDKDHDLYILASALLQLSNPFKSTAYNLNSLDLKNLKNIKGKLSPLEADYVITNPPFGAKIPIKDPEILGQYDFGYVWEFSNEENKWLKTNQIKSSQDPQILFIELCVKLLKDDGKMGIVLPEGVFGNKSSGYVWDYLRNNGQIIGLIDCPRTTFQPGTDTKTNILFFQKTDTSTNAKPTIAVALNCGHDRRGRSTTSNGENYPDDFSEIASEWNSKNHKFGFKAKIDNPYYLVPRYYDRKTDILLQDDAEKLCGEVISFEEMIKLGWITIRKGNEVGSDAYGTGEIPFVRTSDISNFEISIDPTKSVSQEIYQQYSNEQDLKPGNILMVVDGRYRIGRCAILNEYNFNCIAQSHLRIIKLNESKAPLSSYELLYLLSLSSVQRDIRSLVFIQSTLGSIGSRIKEVKIPVPKKRSEEFVKAVENFKFAIDERSKLLSSLTRLELQSVEL